MSPSDPLESPDAVQEMTDMLKKCGCKMYCLYGYIMISHGIVVCKKRAEEGDSDKFVLSQITCTAVILMTCHNGKVGSIVANYDDGSLTYRENYVGFGNIYLSTKYKYVTERFGTGECYKYLNPVFTLGENSGKEYKQFEVFKLEHRGISKSKFIACLLEGTIGVVDIDDYKKSTAISVFRIERDVS